MAKKKKSSERDYLPEPYPMTPAERAAAYAKAKAEFSAADLQRFTEIEELVPMQKVLEELTEMVRNAPTRQE